MQLQIVRMEQIQNNLVREAVPILLLVELLRRRNKSTLQSSTRARESLYRSLFDVIRFTHPLPMTGNWPVVPLSYAVLQRTGNCSIDLAHFHGLQRPFMGDT